MKTLLIILLSIMWFSTIGLLHYICNGQYFWYRVLLTWPFTIAMFKIIDIIIKYKTQVKV